MYYQMKGEMVERIINTQSAAKNMRKSLNEKYSVFDGMIEGVQVIDFNWHYLYLNDAIVKQAHTTKSALMGHTMLEKYPGIENTEMFQSLKEAMTKRIRKEILSEFNFPDGSKGWFELSVQPVNEGILILSSDITSLKRAEAELQKKLSERTQMLSQITKQKLQLEEFCQIIAHNMRAPLSNLILLSNLVQESNDTEEKLHYLKIQKPVVDLLHKTFEELVDATQVRMDFTIKRKNFDLEKQTLAIIMSFQDEIIKSKAEVTYDFTALNTIFYSKKYIKGILSNLIGNALKYHSLKRTPKIHIRSYKKEGWACLEVKDNGLGIDLARNGDDLFKLHKTFHNHPKAKGFGLFITKTQIEAMGGTINAESKPDNGCIFTVKLYKMTENE